MIRGGAGDDALAQAIRELVSQKPAQHNFSTEKDKERAGYDACAAESERKNQGMFRIGG
jgi:hypothetical protein